VPREIEVEIRLANRRSRIPPRQAPSSLFDLTDSRLRSWRLWRPDPTAVARRKERHVSKTRKGAAGEGDSRDI